MRKISDKSMDMLKGLDAYYRKYQVESEDHKLMVELGHPLLAHYEVLRRTFDGLAFASNQDFRYVAWRDDDFHGNIEYAQMRTPRLDIEHVDIGPKFDEFRYRKYVPEKLIEYVRAAAASGWHEDCKPKLEVGFEVATRNVHLATDIYKITKGEVNLPAAQYGSRIVKVSVRPDALTFETACAVLDAIERRMRLYLLPTASEVKNDG